MKFIFHVNDPIIIVGPQLIAYVNNWPLYAFTLSGNKALIGKSDLYINVLRLRSTSSKCIQGPIVCVDNYSWRLAKYTIIIYFGSCTNAPNSLAMLEALPYFKGRSLILAPNIRQGKRFFCVLMCCAGIAQCIAGRHVKKSKIGLELKILRSEAHFLRLNCTSIPAN